MGSIGVTGPYEATRHCVHERAQVFVRRKGVTSLSWPKPKLLFDLEGGGQVGVQAGRGVRGRPRAEAAEGRPTRLPGKTIDAEGIDTGVHVPWGAWGSSPHDLSRSLLMTCPFARQTSSTP
jgi:hypothetical protein